MMPPVRGAGGQCQRMQLATVELGTDGGVDRALLLHAVHAAKALVHHFGRKMLAVIALNDDLGVGKALADQLFDFGGIDRH